MSEDPLFESAAGRGRRKARPAIRAMAVAAIAILLAAAALANLRAPRGPAMGPAPGAAFHEGGRWILEPSYPYDALCLFNYLSGNPYYDGRFEGADAEAVARWRKGMGPAERAAVRRLDWALRRCLGVNLSTPFVALYAIVGEPGLDAFARLLGKPGELRRTHGPELDLFYRVRSGGWRLPAPLFDQLCRDGATLLRYVARAGFEAYWEEAVEPDLEELAGAWRGSVGRYAVLPAVEDILGYPLASDTIRVRLTRFARPSGISLGAADFVVEEGIDAAGLLRTAIHETLHGRVDWTGDARLSGIPAAIVADPVAGEAYRRRDRGAGYNSPVAVAEEALVKALDQLASERLGLAEDARQRWFFHDGGLHAAAPRFQALLGPRFEADSGSGTRIALGERLAALAAAGELEAGDFAATWEESFGLKRPGRLPELPRLVRAYAAGDPGLASLHESYAEALGPGMLLIFGEDWLAIPRSSPGAGASAPDAAAASLLVLDRVARRPAAGLALLAADGERLPLEYRFGGNQSSERAGVSFHHHLSLYYGVADGKLPRPGITYAIVADTASAWSLGEDLRVVWRE